MLFLTPMSIKLKNIRKKDIDDHEVYRILDGIGRVMRGYHQGFNQSNTVVSDKAGINRKTLMSIEAEEDYRISSLVRSIIRWQIPPDRFFIDVANQLSQRQTSKETTLNTAKVELIGVDLVKIEMIIALEKFKHIFHVISRR